MPDDRTDVVASLIAAYGLNGVGDGWPAEPLDESAWKALYGRITSGRLAGHAVAAVQDGALPATAEQETQLVEYLRDRMGRALLLERALIDVTNELERAGVPAIVLKGSAFAHTAYPDPSLRDFDDVDLLVPTDRFAVACQTLDGLGHPRSLADPQPGFVERFGKATVFRTGLFELDIHRTLVLGPFSMWVDAERLNAEHVTFTLGGRSLRCLSPEHRLIHACMHAVLGGYPPFVHVLRDVAQIERSGGIDAEKLARDVRAWRLEPVMAFAVRSVRERLGVEPGPLLGAFEGVRGGRLERKMLGAYLHQGGVGGRTASSMLRVIPGVRPKLAYLRAVLLPDPDFLAQRTGVKDSRLRGYLRRWRLLLRSLRRRRATRTRERQVGGRQ